MTVTVCRTSWRHLDIEVDVRDEVAKVLSPEELNAVAAALALDKAPSLEFPGEKNSEYNVEGVTNG